jgi:hypothetical protein
MKQITVNELWVFPVKGMQGVPVDSIEITDLGIVGDREFAVWEDGHLVDQKADQWVASIGAEYEPITGVLTLSHPEHGEYTHQRRDDGETRRGTWVIDEFDVVDQGDEVAEWLSNVLGRAVRLVDAKEPWRINFPVPQMERLHGNPKIRFNAASPVSIANEASLDDLNEHLDHRVPMDRFRMNVIIEGLDAFEEENLEQLANSDIALSNVSTAERCIIITTDQNTGERPRNNLLRALRAEHMKPKEDRYGSGMKFGNYLTVTDAGFLAVGDTMLATFAN